MTSSLFKLGKLADLVPNDLYTVEELPDTTEGKFGGYKCTPRIESSKYGKVYKNKT